MRTREFTLAFSAAFLGERFGIGAIISTALVALSIFVGRKAKVHSSAPR